MSRTSEPRFHFEEHTLENGLRVILHPDRSVPLVTVHVMYHVGSKDERAGRTGFAHLFEHLLFQGSEHVPREGHFKYIQDAGGTLNGSTWFDRTNYFETLPSNELDLGLWLESDRMGFFKKSITQKKLDNQRDVVINERRQSYENRPYGLAFETVLRNAFPEGHPYRHPTIGYMPDLVAATLEDVHDFFETHYAPGNAVLVLAGDFDPQGALERVRHWFGPIPGRSSPPPVEVPPRLHGGAAHETIRDQVQVPRVYLMYHSPSFNEDEFEVADVLTAVLADGKSSRLEQTLVYDRQLAADVQAFTWPTESVGMLFVVATARPGVGAVQLEEAMREIIDSLAEGVSPREVEGALNRARRALVSQMNSVGERADAFAHATVLRDDPDYVNRVFDRYAAISGEALDDLGRVVFDSSRLTSVHVVPDGDPPPGGS